MCVLLRKATQHDASQAPCLKFRCCQRKHKDKQRHSCSKVLTIWQIFNKLPLARDPWDWYSALVPWLPLSQEECSRSDVPCPQILKSINKNPIWRTIKNVFPPNSKKTETPVQDERNNLSTHGKREKKREPCLNFLIGTFMNSTEMNTAFKRKRGRGVKNQAI